MAKAKNKWEQQRNEVPGLDEAISRQPSTTDKDSEYQSLLAALPADVGMRLQEDVESSLNQLKDVIEHHWCMYESPEGEFPRVRVFPNLELLLDGLSKREGQETAIWVMYGVPLRLSKLTQRPGTSDVYDRYLLLPNQMAAKISSNGVQLIEQSKLPSSVEIQEDGWLGDPALVDSQGFYRPGFVEVDEEPTDDDDESGTN